MDANGDIAAVKEAPVEVEAETEETEAPIDEAAQLTKLLSLECCPKLCLQGQREAVAAVVASLARMSSQERKVSLLTAVAISSKVGTAKRPRSKGERVRFNYFLPFLGGVCRAAFAGCYNISEGTLMRYRSRVVEGIFYPKEHGLKGNSHAAFVDNEGITKWVREFAAAVGQTEQIRVRRQSSTEKTKTCIWLPAEYSWEKLRLEYVKTLPEGARTLSRRSFERIARVYCSDVRIRPRHKKNT